MKKAESVKKKAMTDTLRPSYDFRGGVRGVTAARYAAGSNIVVIDDDLRDVFPNAAAVNDALHALAPLLRKRRLRPTKGKTPGASPDNPAATGGAVARKRRSAAGRGA